MGSGQIAAAEAFLVQSGQALSDAIERQTLHVELDFGVWLTGGVVQSLHLTPALMAAAGTLGIVLCVSLYPSEQEEEED